MITKRILLNLGMFLALAAVLVWMGTGLVIQKGGGRSLVLDFENASGIAARNDVTMRGVPVGAVSNVVLTGKGIAQVTVNLEPGITVPQGTTAQIDRRSPIGDLTLNLTPGSGPALPDGAHLGLGDTRGPPDAERTIAILARVLHAIPSHDIGSLVHQLALTVRGRADDLASLSETTGHLPARLLQIRSQLVDLIRQGPKVTGVFAANAKTFADDLHQTALLADLLRDNRYALVKLSQNGARFAEVANALVSGQKPNLACLISDFGHVNEVLAQPDNLQNLIGTLDLNHFFFDAVWMAVQTGKDGIDWFRVQLLPHTEPPADAYNPKRPPPDVYAADSCSNRYGKGVGPGTQPQPVYLAPGSTLHPGK
ncbi:MAG: MlaD family protein [Actinomycetota bacterium]|nr:MlaD family protein [Actinomycetota bacterium]